MQSALHFIEKIRFGTFIGWLITIVVAVLCVRYLRSALVYLLVKCYEFFIQHKNG